MAKWIRFIYLANSKSGKTKVWQVETASGEPLGEVKWFARWRKYSFFPLSHTVFEKDCLRDIADFCETEMELKSK